MAATATTTLTGTIQKYFEKKWMDQPQEDFRSPLANSELLDEGVLPKHAGQYAEFRKFDHMDPETDGTDDSPKTYAENTEPSSALSVSTSVIQIPLELIRGYVDLGNVQLATDPIDLMAKYKDEMFLYVKRMAHRICNGHLVKGLSRVMSSSAIPPATTYLPVGFDCVYAGGVLQFEDLTAESVYTLATFKRARLLLANVNVPRYPDGYYRAVIDEAIQAQLLEDPEYKDAVKRHQDMYQKAHVKGEVAMIEGFKFVLQDDPYRCNLPAASGALTTRVNEGGVHVAHVFGPHGAGYVPFGGAKTLQRTKMKPQFKVQDISLTGTNVTVGFTLPYQACVFDARRGLNIAGTTRYDESIDDLP